MSLKRIGVLAILVAALGAYLYWYEIPEAQRAARKDKLIAVDQEVITGIDLAFPDRTISLAKRDGTWRLTAPIDAPADAAVVGTLVSALVGAEVQKSLDEVPADLVPFGLDAPAPTVTLSVASGPLPALHLGKTTKIGGKAYVRRGDDPKIYLTLASLPSVLNKQVKELRDKQLLTYQDEQVTRVELTRSGGETTTVAKKAADAWTVSPGDHVADLTEVKSFLSQIRTTRALDFPDDDAKDLATYGLADPRMTIAVTIGGDAPVTQRLLIGAETTQGTQKQVYAKTEAASTIYTIGDWAVRNLEKDVSTLRDKTVLAFDADRVGRIALERKDGPGVTLVREAADWKLDGLEGKAQKAGAASRFVDDLRELRGSGIAAEPAGDLGAFGLDVPDVRIAIVDKDGEAIGTVLAAKANGKYAVMREGGQTVFELRDYQYNRLDKQQRDFLDEPTPAATAPAATAVGDISPPEGE